MCKIIRMNKKESSKLKSIYKMMVNLYGVIDIDNAYEIVSSFIPSISKIELSNDLLLRSGNDNDGYKIAKYDAQHLLIYHDIYLNQFEAEELLNAQTVDSYYIPKNLKEVEYYTDELWWRNDDSVIISDMLEVLINLFTNNSDICSILLDEMRKCFNMGKPKEEIITLLQKYHIDTDKHIIEAKLLMGSYHEMEVYSKSHILKGYSLREIWKEKGEM